MFGTWLIPIALATVPATPDGADTPSDPSARESEKTALTARETELSIKLDAVEGRLSRLELQLPEEDLEPYTEPAPPTPLGVLNPALTVAGDLLYRFDSQEVSQHGARIDNTVNIREVELDLRAAVDPYANGVVVLALGSEVPGDFHAEIEEAYVTIGRLPLPLLDAPPLSLQFKLGRFRTDVGLVNRLHLHDLPWVNRPLVMEELFGDEGYRASGASMRLLLPWFDDDGSLEFVAQVLAGGGIPLAPTEARFPSAIGNLRVVQLIDGEHEFNVAGIFLFARTDPEGNLNDFTYAADVLYKWQPSGSDTRSLVLGGEAFFSNREFLSGSEFHPHHGHDDAHDDSHDHDAEPEVEMSNDPIGYFAYGQVQVNRRTYVGVRWDDTEKLQDTHMRDQAISAYLTWYASEFLRFRLGYEYGFSNQEAGARNSAFAQLDFVFGSHPPHPYWVNP